MKSHRLLFGLLPGIATLSLACSTSLPAQPEKEAVLAPVRTLFKGMLARDSALAATTFYPGATLATVTVDKAGVPTVRKESVANYMKAIASPRTEVWDERIWDPEVRVNGHLAQVWTPYGFFIDNKLHHCGVDAFHLIRTEKGWKIFHVADTRQTEGCVVPEKVMNGE
jgi:hypothetical protein